jgi:hypothetical protein
VDDLKILQRAWERPGPAATAARAVARARLLELASAESAGRPLAHRPRIQIPHLRAWLISAGTAATAAAATAAVVVSLMASGPATTTGDYDAHMTAFVTQRAEASLAAAQHGGAIQQTQFTGSASLLLGANLTPVGRNLTWLAHMSFTKVTVRSYRNRTLVAGFSAGKMLIQAGPATPTRPSWHGLRPRTVLVNRAANLLYYPLVMPTSVQPRLTCRDVSRAVYNAPFLMSRTAASPSRWNALIRAALSCGEFKLVGKQRVDGALADKLIARAREVRRQEGAQETLWVNAKTFLPVRFSFGPNAATVDFRWLPPTAANLARLHVTIPAGAAMRRLPPHTGILFWQLGQWDN